MRFLRRNGELLCKHAFALLVQAGTKALFGQEIQLRFYANPGHRLNEEEPGTVLAHDPLFSNDDLIWVAGVRDSDPGRFIGWRVQVLIHEINTA